MVEKGYQNHMIYECKENIFSLFLSSWLSFIYTTVERYGVSKIFLIYQYFYSAIMHYIQKVTVKILMLQKITI